MSDPYDSDGKAWFRPKRLGYGWTPASWQGWLATLVFAVTIVFTTLLAGPQGVRPGSVERFARMKSAVGLGHVALPWPAMLAIIVAEVAVFLVFCRWMSRGPTYSD